MPAASDVLGEIRRVVEHAISDPLLREVARCELSGDALVLRLHPAADSLVITDEKDGSIRWDATTSAAGPGYHCFVAELLRAVGRETGLVWQSEDGNVVDYAWHTDAERVNKEMSGWFARVAEAVLELAAHDQEQVFYIAMAPLGVATMKGRVLTSQGPRSLEWLTEARGGELPACAQTFFSWWDVNLTAEVWLRFALAKAWLDLPWRRAFDESESREYEVSLKAFDRARQLDPSLALPTEDVAEIRSILYSPDFVRPRPYGLGYRRQTLTRSIPLGWKMDLPGWFWDMVEDDGRTVLFGTDGLTVRLSPMSVEKASSEVAPEELLASGAILRHVPNPLHWVRQGDLHGIAQVFEPTLGETVSSLHAATAAPNNLCIVTIDFREPFDSSSALTLWRSLRARAKITDSIIQLAG